MVLFKLGLCTVIMAAPGDDFAVDFVTPLKKRRLARESLSVDGSLRSISEEEDSPSALTASPPMAMPPIGTSSAVDNLSPADEHHCQVISRSVNQSMVYFVLQPKAGLICTDAIN